MRNVTFFSIGIYCIFQLHFQLQRCLKCHVKGLHYQGAMREHKEMLRYGHDEPTSAADTTPMAREILFYNLSIQRC